MPELNPPAQAGGIYVHVPFCLRKCPYCDFFSVTDRSLVPMFIDALRTEMHLTGDLQQQFDTLYLGGGTPSLLQPEQVAYIVSAAGRSYLLAASAEITLEVNPGTVAPDRLKGYRDAGVNRLNIGVQSFRDANLSFLGRVHTAEAARQALRWSRQSGFDNIGMDLIYGLPGQTEVDWLVDLEQAVAQQPEHLSCYMLSYERGTPLYRLREQQRIRPLADERVGALFQTTISFLEQRGYAHYEVSNFARSPRFQSRHNCKYWNFAPYIGLGPSAHSFLPPSRRWNHGEVNKYVRDLNAGKLPLAGEESLTGKQEMVEAVYLGLRQTQGIALDRFEERFGKDFPRCFGSALPGLVEEGLVHLTRAHCRLTGEGMLFLDTVAARLVSELD